MAQVKGTAVQASLRYVRERFGEGPLAGVIEALPEGDRAAFGGGILASSWYPMDAFLRFMQEAERQLDLPCEAHPGVGRGEEPPIDPLHLRPPRRRRLPVRGKTGIA